MNPILLKSHHGHVRYEFPANPLSTEGATYHDIADEYMLIGVKVVEVGETDNRGIVGHDRKLFAYFRQRLQLTDCEWMCSFGIDEEEFLSVRHQPNDCLVILQCRLAYFHVRSVVQFA